MKIKNLYTYTTCALALLTGVNFTAYAMEGSGSDTDRESITAQTRISAQRIGIPAPENDSDITPDVRDGYVTAAKVYKFYRDVRSENPAYLPDATPEEWAELARTASQHRFSPLFQAILDRFNQLDSYNTVSKASFMPMAEAYEHRLTDSKQYTPLEMADLLESFINDTNTTYWLNVRKRTLTSFLSFITTELPVDLIQQIQRSGDSDRASSGVVLPENSDELGAFLDREKALIHAITPFSALLKELLSTEDNLDSQLRVLSDRLSALALANQTRDLVPHTYTVRDYIYATFLKQQKGSTAEATERAKQDLLSTKAFEFLDRSTRDKPPFGQESAQEASPRKRLADAKAHLEASMEDLQKNINDLITLYQATQKESNKIDERLNATLRDIAHKYKDILWAKTQTLESARIPQ